MNRPSKKAVGAAKGQEHVEVLTKYDGPFDRGRGRTVAGVACGAIVRERSRDDSQLRRRPMPSGGHDLRQCPDGVDALSPRWSAPI